MDFLNGVSMGELDMIRGMSVEARNAKALSIHPQWLQRKSEKEREYRNGNKKHNKEKKVVEEKEPRAYGDEK